MSYAISNSSVISNNSIPNMTYNPVAASQGSSTLTMLPASTATQAFSSAGLNGLNSGINSLPIGPNSPFTLAATKNPTGDNSGLQPATTLAQAQQEATQTASNVAQQSTIYSDANQNLTTADVKAQSDSATYNSDQSNVTSVNSIVQNDQANLIVLNSKQL